MRVAVDTSGPPLAEAVRALPDLVKPNREELEELTGRPLGDREALAGAARELVDAGVSTVVVSLGAEGALFVRAGEAVFATPPQVTVASTVGAGDAMMAATIAGFLRGLPRAGVDALATATAATKIGRVGPYLDTAAAEAASTTVAVHPL
jgi:fructose-1-phosphate kinase PfkB-like protein